MWWDWFFEAWVQALSLLVSSDLSLDKNKAAEVRTSYSGTSRSYSASVDLALPLSLYKVSMNCKTTEVPSSIFWPGEAVFVESCRVPLCHEKQQQQ